MENNELGIFCKKDKNFYFLETGNIVLGTTVTRIKKILIQRGLIAMTDSSYTDIDQYEIMKIKEAKEKELSIIPLYLNKHVKSVKENEKETTNKW